MPGVNDYPRMEALTGDEVLLGSQSGTTETVSLAQLRAYVEQNIAAQVGVATINGQSGDVTLTAQSIGADPAGSAESAETAARAHANALISDHLGEQNPHGLTAATINLGNVANLAPADLPISNATQAALNDLSTAVAGKISDAPSNGSEYVRKNGAWAPASTASSTIVRKTESEWASFTPDPNTYYVVVPDPPPANLITGDPTANAGFSVVGGKYVLQGSTAFNMTWPLSGTTAGRTYRITFSVENHIKANITPGFFTDGTRKLHTTTRQGTASPGTTTTYTVDFAPSGGAPASFVLWCNLQDTQPLQGTIHSVSVTVV